MCQENYSIEKGKNKEFKYKHLNYTERTQIERWKNNLSRPTFGFKSLLEMAKQYC